MSYHQSVAAWVLFLFFVVVGCGGNPTPVVSLNQGKLPPSYNYGDIVQPTGTQRVCIVTARVQGRVDGFGDTVRFWEYTVIHQNLTFTYKQDDLVLLHRFDWSVPTIDWSKLSDDTLNVKPEVESDEEMEIIE